MGGTDGDRDQAARDYEEALRVLQAGHERRMRELRERYPDLDLNSSPQCNSPFYSFKRFVDTNLSALSDSVRNFPSNLAELRAKMQREQERRKQEELDISQRWTGSSDSPDHIQMGVQRSTLEERDEAHALTLMLLSEALRKNAHVPVDKIEALYRDPQSRFGDLDRFASPMLSLGGACYYMPETGDNLPSTRTWRWTCASPPRWLSVDWFRRSPYSPIRLEAHPDLAASEGKWRAAFEDLLNATLDKPMVTEERWGYVPGDDDTKVQSTRTGPGLGWMYSLQCRGILPPLLPRFYNNPGGKRDTRHKTLWDLINNARSDIPWSNDNKLAFCSSMHKDLSDLRSEVAIKAFPETKIPATVPVSPTTEQDLYDSIHIYAPAISEERPTRTTGPKSGPLSGDAADDYGSALQAMRSAAEAGDLQAMAKLDDAWHEKYSASEAPETVTEESKQWMPLIKDIFANPDAAASQVGREIARHQEQFFKFAEQFSDPKQLPDGIIKEILTEFGAIEREREPEAKDLGYTQLPENKSPKHLASRETPEETMHSTHMPLSASKPDVLSALTTTHTTRSPDGTVTTKVVLRKRFADGREETQESVHASHESIEQDKHVDARAKEKAKGWFWS